MLWMENKIRLKNASRFEFSNKTKCVTPLAVQQGRTHELPCSSLIAGITEENKLQQNALVKYKPEEPR